MPIGMICSLRWTDGRPIKRRAVVSAKKLAMVIRGLNIDDLGVIGGSDGIAHYFGVAIYTTFL